MSRLVRDFQLVEARGRKYLNADERRRFLKATDRPPRLANQTLAFHARSHRRPDFRSLGAICPTDVDLEAASIRIRTLSAVPSAGARSRSLPSCYGPSSSSTRSARRRRRPPADFWP